MHYTIFTIPIGVNPVPFSKWWKSHFLEGPLSAKLVSGKPPPLLQGPPPPPPLPPPAPHSPRPRSSTLHYCTCLPRLWVLTVNVFADPWRCLRQNSSLLFHFCKINIIWFDIGCNYKNDFHCIKIPLKKVNITSAVKISIGLHKKCKNAQANTAVAHTGHYPSF